MPPSNWICRARRRRAQIIKHETRLGERLLLRTTRQVSTSSMRRLLPALRGDPAEIDDAEEGEGAGSAPSANQSSRWICPARLARLWDSGAGGFLIANIRKITLEIGIGDRYIDLVRDGVDCVLRAGELADSSLVARRLTLLPQVTCASAAYLGRIWHAAYTGRSAAHRVVDYFSASSGKIAATGIRDRWPDADTLRVAGPRWPSTMPMPMSPPAKPGWESCRRRVTTSPRSWQRLRWWNCCRSSHRRALPLALLYPQQRHCSRACGCWLGCLNCSQLVDQPAGHRRTNRPQPAPILTPLQTALPLPRSLACRPIGRALQGCYGGVSKAIPNSGMDDCEGNDGYRLLPIPPGLLSQALLRMGLTANTVDGI